MIKRGTILFAALGSLVVSLPLLAHHTFAAHFIPGEISSVKGVVTEWWFENPHSRIYLDVTGTDGSTEEWMLEGQSRNVLIRRGWTGDEIKVGDVLTAQGEPSRDGSNSIHYRVVTFEDGRTLGQRPGGAGMGMGGGQ
jgi:hypothetical protein